METLTFDRWVLEVDREATTLAYEHISPGPETCGCWGCRNFAAQRPHIYPAELLELCERLGIPPAKECEVWECGREPDGKHTYGGWFHFVGRVEIPPDARDHQFTAGSGGFAFYFAPRAHCVPDALKGLPVAQLEFTTRLPWVLGEPES